jgi:hypothetical protein
MNKFYKSSAALDPSVCMKPRSFCFQGEEYGQDWWRWCGKDGINQFGVLHGYRQPSLQAFLTFYLKGQMQSQEECIKCLLVDVQVVDILPWDLETYVLEGTC